MLSCKIGNHMTFTDFYRETCLPSMANSKYSIRKVGRLMVVPFMEKHFPDHVPNTGITKKKAKKCALLAHLEQNRKEAM